MSKREIHSEEEVKLHDAREVSEDELQAMKERTDKSKEEAIEALKDADSFAIFALKSTPVGKDKELGVQVIVAGEMGMMETMQLLHTMHDTVETITESLHDEVHTAIAQIRKKRHGK